MILSRVFLESTSKLRMQYFSPTVIFWSHTGMTSGYKQCHTTLCPTNKNKIQTKQHSVTTVSSSSSGPGGKLLLKRAEYSGKVRMGFIPEEFFQFLHPKTGVTGPYLLLISLANYCISKEIYVMEHEYYLGISIFLVVVYVAKKFGKSIGASLDKHVDAIASKWETDRKNEITMYENFKKEWNLEIWRAEGQKLLMDAKKENVKMQLEAEYRDRAMRVYQGVKGRMDYHVKKHKAEARIHQKWMIEWILNNVMKSINPEFEKRALEAAIRDLSSVSGRTA